MKTNSQIFFLSLVCATAFAATSGCSVHADSPPVDLTGGQYPKPAPPASPAAPVAPADAGLQGSWVSACKADQGSFSQQKLTFVGSKYTDETNYFSDAACSGTAGMSMSMEGTFEVKGASLTESGGYDVDVTPDGSTSPFFSTTLVEGATLYLPNSSEISPISRPAHVDRSRPYTKL